MQNLVVCSSGEAETAANAFFKVRKEVFTLTSCFCESSGSWCVKHMHLNKLAKENSNPPFSADFPELCCMRNPNKPPSFFFFKASFFMASSCFFCSSKSCLDSFLGTSLLIKEQNIDTNVSLSSAANKTLLVGMRRVQVFG